MIQQCAWCGDFCDGGIWSKRTFITEVNRILGRELPISVWTTYETKYFCTGNHRNAFLYGP